ncbi:hypothetical protein B7R74_21995 [Yersinia pseudotuberculosis]|uniref:Uncharacterized protein n=2 Tax=Yersinia TaxID=629 RepID=A0A0T9RH51_9GAMM|nr:hypothetical protein BF17_00050 [Yersinia similis]PSH11147.1 hypothetical protein B7R74_21995 [Yersinia pseudotuberculosis]CFQ66751.1 Uncharacterised protein [Yersinia similis]CNB81095.1 Uncharacterised protein [Yersinia similis]CNI62360.1 Uncharacterised protein [Yersinia pekkanenii]
MFKSLGSVALDILSYILAFIFSGLSILVATLFPEKFVLFIAVVGILFSFYISDVLIDKVR